MEYEVVQGVSVPKIGFGTWQLTGPTGYAAVRSALELGYRHLDTAEIYGNEREVGRAIADSGVDRAELFVVTKVWPEHLGYSPVLEAAAASLGRLGLERVDLYLIHWPRSRMPIVETMRAMDQLVREGRIAQVGVSNFSVEQFEQARQALSVNLFTNQIPFAVGEGDWEFLEYCRRNDVLLTAYSPLDRGRLARSRRLKAVGDRHGKTAAQVALRWCVQQEKVVAIPKASSPERQRENLEVFDFELTEEDLTALHEP
jgi:diketogulonate reductase-like aldo/keto reductase